MNSIDFPKLTTQEQRLFDLLKSGGKYTVAEIVSRLGQCDPRGHISRMRRKGIAVEDERVTLPNGVNFKRYWLADDRHGAFSNNPT